MQGSGSTVNCTKCGEVVPDSWRTCPACGEDAGFPNVRLAERQEEVENLEKRLATAFQSSEAAGYSEVLTDFGRAVSTSMAIIARPLRVILDFIENDRRLYSTYHLDLLAGARIPEDNIFDKTRTQFENALFPNYYQNIRFAALTLDGRWHEWFGDYAIIFKDQMIEHRATVFEENPYEFARRHEVRLIDVFPPGYRAVWSCRQNLAMAKLYPKLDKETKLEEYASILMPEGDADASKDFIEVHIFGPFNCSAVHKVVGSPPRSREDKFFWKKLKKIAVKAGIEVEEV